MYRTLINLIGRRVTQPQPVVAREKPSYEVELAHLRRLRALQHLFPQPHVEYLQHMKRSGIEPRVIYDVGANVLHWTHAASTVWPGASYFAFEAMDEAAALYAEEGIPHHMGVLSDRNGREVKFYVSPQHPGGNSYYKENSRVNRDADTYFPDSYARVVRTVTL